MAATNWAIMASASLDASVEVRDEGVPERMTLALRDGTLNANVVPGGRHFVVELQGKGWRLPVGPPVLFDALRLETPFQISNGVLHGVDIRKAAASVITRDSSGDTRFDQLSGHLVMAGGTRRLSNLKVAAGGLAADGHVTIAADRSLSGRINAQLNAGAITAASVALNVSGTLDSSLLLPTAAADAGAVAGTTVLGPAGAAVGAKAGGAGWGGFSAGRDNKGLPGGLSCGSLYSSFCIGSR